MSCQLHFWVTAKHLEKIWRAGEFSTFLVPLEFFTQPNDLYCRKCGVHKDD